MPNKALSTPYLDRGINARPKNAVYEKWQACRYASDSVVLTRQDLTMLKQAKSGTSNALIGVSVDEAGYMQKHDGTMAAQTNGGDKIFGTAGDAGEKYFKAIQQPLKNRSQLSEPVPHLSVACAVAGFVAGGYTGSTAGEKIVDFLQEQQMTDFLISGMESFSSLEGSLLIFISFLFMLLTKKV